LPVTPATGAGRWDQMHQSSNRFNFPEELPGQELAGRGVAEAYWGVIRGTCLL